MQWTVRQLAEALGVAAPAGLAATATLSGVSIDSRTIHPGELFIAIRGPRHDGHNFVGQVLEGGNAVAAVVDRESIAGYSQEMRAKVVEAEAQVPLAMAEAFRSGHLGVMDYYRMQNIQSDTRMRQSISGEDTSKSGQAS